MIDEKTPILKALEADLERETQALENGAIRISEILAEIKDSGVWKTEANYSTFEAHYEARQPKRIEAMRIVVSSLWIQERVGRAVHKKRGVPRPGWGALLCWTET
jgi:hypothetical protein